MKRVNPTKNCRDILQSYNIMPSNRAYYNSVIDFFAKVNDNLHLMDKPAIACVKKQVTLLNRSNDEKIVRRVIKEEKAELLNRIGKIDRVNATKSTGTTLKIGAPRIFREFR